MIRRAGRPEPGPSERASIRRWWLLAACFVTFMVSAAFMQSYTVFLVAFIETFGWSRGEASIAYAVSQFVSGVTSLLVGVLVDRLGPRRLVLIGGSLLALGLIASSYVHALWHVILLYGIIMTLGANCLGLVVFVPMLSRHFVQNRGMAVAILQSANGFARGFSAPLTQLLIGEFGWRWTYLVQGGFMAAAILPLSALFRGTDPVRAAATAGATPDGWTLSRAIRTSQFWLLFLVYVFTGLGSFLVALHQLAFAVTVGFDKLYAAQVLGIGALFSFPGVIMTGWLSDRIGRELSAIITYGTSIFGVACALLIRGPDQHLLFWLHACFFGLTWGARGPSITAKTADLFPGSRLGTILGAITIGTGVGSAGGSWLAGWSFDLTGSYHLAFWLSIFFYACGSVAFWLLREPAVIRQ